MRLINIFVRKGLIKRYLVGYKCLSSQLAIIDVLTVFFIINQNLTHVFIL